MSNKYILFRPVNSLKKVYSPSYLASKIRAENRSDLYAKIIEQSVRKKLNSSDQWAYKEHAVFKGVDIDGRNEYRRFLTPSPSTSSAEAYIINEISDKLNQKKSKRVYSYIFSEKNSNSNYKYYYPFYEQRNTEILNALSVGVDRVVVFLDIKNFYNSIDKDNLIKVLKDNEVFTSAEGSVFLDFFINQLNEYEGGVPIGTDLSHVMADIFLEKFDCLLEAKFGENYFRYVDDISIVCHRSEVQSACDFVSEKLEYLKLELNNEKYEVIDFHGWSEIVNSKAIEGDDFHDFCNKINNWISGDYSKLNWLSSEFRNLGFQVPLKKVFSSFNNVNEEIIPFFNEKELINYAIEIKNNYKNALNDIAESINPGNNRWFLQKIKKTINPLFYLLDKEEYKLLINASYENKKLKNQEILSFAMHFNDCSSLVEYPGVTVNAFCEMFINNEGVSGGMDFVNASLDKSSLETASILAMFEIVEANNSLENCSLWRALKPGIKMATDNLPLFESEVESLRIGIDSNKQRQLLLSRYASGEDMYLSALDLGNQSISD